MSFILLDTVGRHDKQVKLPCGLDTVQPPLEGIQTKSFWLIVERIFSEICVFFYFLRVIYYDGLIIHASTIS